MKIAAIRLEREPGLVRAAARIEWEDCGRDPSTLAFEADAGRGDDLEPAPEAFLTACALPAMRAGERRIAIEASVSARLAAGVARAVEIVGSWYGGSRRAVAIEPARRREEARRRTERTAMFFTGGADSRHMLQASRRGDLPAVSHPIEGALSTFGHLCPSTPETLAWNARVVPVLARAAEAQGLEFAAVRSNVWDLAPSVKFLAEESLGSALAASAHLFPGRWTRMLIASGHEEDHQPLRGTHPELDPLFSTEAVEITHVPSPRGRLERLRVGATAPGGLDDLVVCLAFPGPPALNCGECEKCVRTMAELVALGLLERARWFPRALSAGMIRGIRINGFEERFWIEVLPELEARGRGDLTGVIREKLAGDRRIERWQVDAGWKGRLRRWDRRILGGRLLALSRRMRG